MLAEDDKALAGFVRKGLEAESCAADVSADGEQARAWPVSWITTWLSST